MHDLQTRIPDRHREILQTVIETFIETASPVGSRTVSKELGRNLSPASIRNVMADLEDEGLLHQPHSSAGRVPTVEAFRYWIDHLVKPRQPGARQRLFLQEAVGDDHTSTKDRLERLAGALSSMTGGAAVALAPLLDHGRLQRAELIPVAGRRLLLLWVTQRGLVYHREFDLPFDVRAEDVAQLEQTLNREYGGCTFEEIRIRLRRDLHDVKSRYDDLLNCLLSMAETSQDELIVEGVRRMVGLPDFGNIEALRRLYETFEDRHALAAILERVARIGGLRVLINEETGLEGSGLGVVASAYGGNGSARGSIGVIGPTRMPYPRILGLVSYASSLVDPVSETF